MEVGGGEGNNSYLQESESEGRSRRSLAYGGGGPDMDDNHPPDIAPVGGVPNLKGKVVIRPIAFRPTPGRPSSSTGPLPPVSRPGSSAPSPGPLLGNGGIMPYAGGSRPGSSAPSPGPLGGCGGGSLMSYANSVGPPCSRPGSSAPSPGPLGVCGGPPFSRPPSQGFAPGHPLVRQQHDGPRPFGSSQELNRNQTSVMSKFSSLDRRSANQRSCRGISTAAGFKQTIPSNGLSKMTYSYDTGSSTSLPPVSLTAAAVAAAAAASTSPSVTVSVSRTGGDATAATTAPAAGSGRPLKEPERRHSLYDSASRGQYQPGTAAAGRTNPTPPHQSAQPPSYLHAISSHPINAINTNGLPEGGGGLHCSRSSLTAVMLAGPSYGDSALMRTTSASAASHHLPPASAADAPPRSRHSGAGTPQFRGSSGHGQFMLSRSSRGSLSNLSCSVGGSSGGSGFTVLQRSISGNSIHMDDQGQLGPRADHLSFKGSCSTIDQEYNTTPSPSDSAVGDLENVLKEKDSEIVYLRETMEQNEQVIFKVYEEKERVWEKEIRKIKGLYENRLRANQQKAYRMEQALLNQTLQVQNEKRRLEMELAEVAEARDRQVAEAKSLEAELTSLRKSLEEEPESLPVGASSNRTHEQPASTEGGVLGILRAELAEVWRLLKAKNAQLTELRTDKKKLTSEVINLRSLLDLEQEEGGCTVQQMAEQKGIIIDRDRSIEKLQARLAEAEREKGDLKAELDRFRENFQAEQTSWLDEKEKVIRYQKQLQLNYVQMYKKNKTLETEIDQLKKSLAESSHKQGQSAKSRLFSKFSKFHNESQC